MIKILAKHEKRGILKIFETEDVTFGYKLLLLKRELLCCNGVHNVALHGKSYHCKWCFKFYSTEGELYG